MKLSNLFWGSLFISFGILWTNYYFDIIHINFEGIESYWSVLFILIGLIILKLSKVINVFTTILASLFITMMLIGFLQSNDDLDININWNTGCISGIIDECDEIDD